MSQLEFFGALEWQGRLGLISWCFFRSAHEPIDLPNVETFIASVDQSVLDTLRKFTFLLLLQWNLLRGLLSRFCSTER